MAPSILIALIESGRDDKCYERAGSLHFDDWIRFGPKPDLRPVSSRVDAKASSTKRRFSSTGVLAKTDLSDQMSYSLTGENE